MPKTALTIVFNHRYEQNLGKLRVLYGDRFSNLQHLMPFARSTDEDVIPVYDSSYCFYAYFVQAWPRLALNDCDYYAFVGDDFILNPRLNEANLSETLKLDGATSFISELLPLSRAPLAWWRLRTVLKEIKVASGYFKWLDELPPVDVGLKKYHDLGLPTDELQWSGKHSVSGILPLNPGKTFRQHLISRLAMAYMGTQMAYPMAWGYSDFIVLPRAVMPDFIHYCRVFAAMGIFAECGAPSALALASPRVNTEATVDRRSTIAWGDAQAQLLQSVGNSLASLEMSFAETEIGKHPVKLSAFKS